MAKKEKLRLKYYSKKTEGFVESDFMLDHMTAVEYKYGRQIELCPYCTKEINPGQKITLIRDNLELLPNVKVHTDCFIQHSKESKYEAIRTLIRQYHNLRTIKDYIYIWTGSTMTETKY